MVDFIKIERLKSEIRKNPLLEGKWIFTSNEDAFILKEEAMYKKLKFETKKFKESNNYNSKLSGSIHYYFNNGIHNSNDFRFSDIVEVIDEICDIFQIDSSNNLNNIEFGVNIKLPFDPKIILDNLVTHKGKLFSFESSKGMSYRQCKHSQFYIKIYDKGLQFGLAENILRFEIKVVKMQYLQNNGIDIKYLKCLKNRGIYEPLGRLLLKAFNETLIDCESVDLRRLSEAERITYLKATKPNTWIKANRVKPLNQKQLQRLSEKYYKIIDSKIIGKSKKKQIAELIENKWSELSEIYNTKKEGILTNIVQYLPFKYNVRFGHNVLIQYNRPSIYSRDF